MPPATQSSDSRVQEVQGDIQSSSNLDTKTSREVHQLLFRLNEEQKITMLIVTHNPELASQVPRSIHMKDGRLIGDSVKSAEELAAARNVGSEDAPNQDADAEQ